jgi:hypothetical protein
VSDEIWEAIPAEHGLSREAAGFLSGSTIDELTTGEGSKARTLWKKMFLSQTGRGVGRYLEIGVAGFHYSGLVSEHDRLHAVTDA